MSNAESDDRMSLLQHEWFHRTGPGALESHLGRKLRALYDALPTQPPSADICTQLRRLDEAGARDQGRSSNR